ncbi:MAG: hypothetical protein HWE25_11200 [Alphaproteobacteria bacterium]|nr:hypothetical protein [Alphaproteobacteria bacterium]
MKKITGGLGNKITLENADEILFKLQQQDGEGPEIIQDVQEPRGENPIESWLDWGSFLKRKYDIDQYAIIFWDDTRP